MFVLPHGDLEEKSDGARWGNVELSHVHGPGVHARYSSVWPFASQQLVLACDKCGGSGLAIWCNAEVLVLMVMG